MLPQRTYARVYTVLAVSVRFLLKHSIKSNCLVNLYNKHLISYTALLLYGGLWPAEEWKEEKSKGRKARVRSDVDSRRGDGHRVDVRVDLAGSTKSFYVFFFRKISSPIIFR